MSFSALPGLTLSWLRGVFATGANLIDDDTRAAGTQGDGRAQESSVGIWQAATNLETNGGFETNTTGWTTGGTNTIARSTTQKLFGADSLKATYADSTSLAIHAGITFTAARYVASRWVWIPTAWDGGQIQITVANLTSVTTNWSAHADMALRDQWQRIRVAFTPDAGDLTGDIRVIAASAPTATRFIYVDGAQHELASIATPYVETNGGTASRSAGRLQLQVGALDETAGWLAIRLRAGHASTDITSGNGIVWTWADDATNFLQLRYDYANTRWEFERRTTAGTVELTAADTFAIGDKVTLIVKWTATDISISIDGGNFTTVGNTRLPTLAATTMDVGSDGASGSYLNGDVFWLAFGTGAPTNGNASTINGFGDTDTPSESWPAIGLLSIWYANRGSSETFTRYNVYRRKDGETDWVRIATISDATTVTYSDYTVKHAVIYEYTVTVTVTVDGSEVESDKDTSPPEDSVSFTNTDKPFLHAVNDPTVYVEFKHQSEDIPSSQDISFVQTWGSTAPIAQIGEQRSRGFGIQSVVMPITEVDLWPAVQDLQDAKQTLCYRTAYAGGDVVFCQLVDPVESRQPAQHSVTFKLVECKFDEAV